MTAVDRSRVARIAEGVRDAIEAARDAKELRSEPLRGFPRACCDDASDLLAQSLLENGIMVWCVGGTCYGRNPEDMQPHAWLELEDDTVIDITRDQFRLHPEPLRSDEPVYVGDPDTFCRQFSVKRRDRFLGIEAYGEPARSNLLTAYEVIKRHLTQALCGGA